MSIKCMSCLLKQDCHSPATQISDIQEVCPEVTDLEAFKALDMCSNR